MSESNQSQRPQTHQKIDEQMNEPGEIDLNKLKSSRIMCQEDKVFELQMNDIDLQQIDFDLSRKDQDSPENLEFAQIISKESMMIEEKDKNLMQQSNLSRMQKQQEKQQQNIIQTVPEHVENISQIDQRSLNIEEINIQREIIEENPQQKQRETIDIKKIDIQNKEIINMENQIDKTSSLKESSAYSNQVVREEVITEELIRDQSEILNSNTNENSVLIESSSSQKSNQKFQIKLMIDNLINNKLQHDSKIKQQNIIQLLKPQKLQFMFSDQKKENLKSRYQNEDFNLKQNHPKLKGLYEKKESFNDSQSVETDPSLKIDFYTDQKLINSHLFEKNLLKEFKNESFEVRDKYFEKQSQIYKKYILNMQKTLRKQYQKCRLHDITIDANNITTLKQSNEQKVFDQNVQRLIISSKEENHFSYVFQKLQKPQKNYNYSTQNENGFIRQDQNIVQSQQHENSYQAQRRNDDKELNSLFNQEEKLLQQFELLRKQEIQNSSIQFRNYLQHIMLQMSAYIDISDKIQAILKMDYKQLMKLYVNVVGLERIVKFESFEGISNTDNVVDRIQQELNEQSLHYGQQFQQSINLPEDKQKSAQRNTHFHHNLSQQVLKQNRVVQQQLIQNSCIQVGKQPMSIEQGQMGSIPQQMRGLIENEDDECTPMFGQFNTSNGNSNIETEMGRSDDKAIVLQDSCEELEQKVMGTYKDKDEQNQHNTEMRGTIINLHNDMNVEYASTQCVNITTDNKYNQQQFSSPVLQHNTFTTTTSNLQHQTLNSPQLQSVPIIAMINNENKQSSSGQNMSCQSIRTSNQSIRTSKSIEDMSAQELRQFIKNSLVKKGQSLVVEQKKSIIPDVSENKNKTNNNTIEQCINQQKVAQQVIRSQQVNLNTITQVINNNKTINTLQQEQQPQDNSREQGQFSQYIPFQYQPIQRVTMMQEQRQNEQLYNNRQQGITVNRQQGVTVTRSGIEGNKLNDSQKERQNVQKETINNGGIESINTEVINKPQLQGQVTTVNQIQEEHLTYQQAQSIVSQQNEIQRINNNNEIQRINHNEELSNNHNEQQQQQQHQLIGVLSGMPLSQEKNMLIQLEQSNSHQLVNKENQHQLVNKDNEHQFVNKENEHQPSSTTQQQQLFNTTQKQQLSNTLEQQHPQLSQNQLQVNTNTNCINRVTNMSKFNKNEVIEIISQDSQQSIQVPIRKPSINNTNRGQANIFNNTNNNNLNNNNIHSNNNNNQANIHDDNETNVRNNNQTNVQISYSNHNSNMNYTLYQTLTKFPSSINPNNQAIVTQTPIQTNNQTIIIQTPIDTTSPTDNQQNQSRNSINTNNTHNNINYNSSNKDRVQACDVRRLLLQSYPNIQNIISAASDQQILTLYYQLTGRDQQSQHSHHQHINNNNSNIINNNNNTNEGIYERQIILNNNNDITNIDGNTSYHIHNHNQTTNNSLQSYYHLLQQQTQLTQQQQQLTTIQQQSLVPQQQSYKQDLTQQYKQDPTQQYKQYKQDLTPQQLDLVIQNLIQSNSQIKEQISKLSRQDLLALYRQGIKQMNTRKSQDHTISNTNNNNNKNKTIRKNKKTIAQIIDLQDDQNEQQIHINNGKNNINNNMNNNNSQTINNQTTTNNFLQSTTNKQKIHIFTQNNQHNDQNYIQSQNYDQQQQPYTTPTTNNNNPQTTTIKPTFSYIQQYNQSLNQKHNQKHNKLSKQPITYSINKTLLYAYIQAHDYQKSLQSILKPRQSIKYQQQTQKQIAITYLKSLKNNNQKTTGLQTINQNINKSSKTQKEQKQNTFIIMGKNNDQKDIQSQQFKNCINQSNYLTIEKTYISEEKKAKILELRNKRIMAQQRQLQLNDLEQSNQYKPLEQSEGSDIPKLLSGSLYMNTLLSAPKKSYRKRYYLIVDHQALDPLQQEEIGLQQNKKRVKRTSIEKDESKVAQMIKMLAKNVEYDMGIQLE